MSALQDSHARPLPQLPPRLPDCLPHGCCCFARAALAVAVFRAYPQQRGSLVDEVLSTVVAHVPVAGAKGPPRLYEATDAALRPLHIQMATALVLQMVQVRAGDAGDCARSQQQQLPWQPRQP